MLVREYIRKSLYAIGEGYFSKTNCVYSPPAPVPFTTLLGKLDYIGQLDRLYKGRSEAWLTPVEIFRPWYSRALANYMVQKWQDPNKPLIIYEVGGGNGTNAIHILDYLQEKAPELYKNVQYTLVEISDTMCKRQHDLVAKRHAHVNIVNSDFVHWNRGIVKEECFVLLMEVLDNLPHDKIVRKFQDSKSIPNDWWIFDPKDAASWYQVQVQLQNTKHTSYKETLGPLQDPLILKTATNFLSARSSSQTALTKNTSPSSLRERLQQWARRNLATGREKMEAGDPTSNYKSVFIPTGAMQLLDTLHTHFPKHHLIAADFDVLPPPELSFRELYNSANQPGSLYGCRNAPLVASKDADGQTVDHPTYLVKLGLADIFFQTDFHALQSVYEETTGRSADIKKSQTFLEEFSEHSQTCTRSGYNPMLEDYHNTKFILS